MAVLKISDGEEATVIRDGEVLFTTERPPEPPLPPEWKLVVLWQFDKSWGDQGLYDIGAYNEWADDQNEIPTEPREYIDGPFSAHYNPSHRALNINENLNFEARLFSDDPDPHCSLRPRSPHLHDGIRTELGQTYGHVFTVRFRPGSEEWLERVSWAVIIQHWQVAGLNPPFALMVKKGQWAVQQYADASGQPQDNDSWPLDRSQNNLGEVLANVWYKFRVLYKPHPVDGKTVVECEGSGGFGSQDWMYEIEGPNCCNIDRGTVFFHGLYTPLGELPENGVAVEYPDITYAQIVEQTTPPEPPPTLPPANRLIRPETLGVVIPVSDWSAWGLKRVGTYGSIMQEQFSGRFQAWFTGMDLSGRRGCYYAESANGLDEWRQNQQQVLENCDCVSVTRDQLDPYTGAFCRDMHHVGGASADGLQWGDFVELNQLPGDVSSLVEGQGLIYKHHYVDSVGQTMRRWYFGNTPLTGVTEQRPPGYVRGDCYQLTAMRLDDIWVGLESLLLIERRDGPADYGSIIVRLMRSHDLINWEPVFGLEPFLELHEPIGDPPGQMMIAWGPIIVGDTYRVYYSWTGGQHGMFGSIPGNSTEVYLAEGSVSDLRRMVAG